MRACINCGAPLAEGASFCPHCATPQREKEAMAPPRRRRKGAAALGVPVLCAALIFALVSWGEKESAAAPVPSESAVPVPSESAVPVPRESAAPAPSESAAPVSSESAAPVPSENPAPVTVEGGASAVYTAQGKEYRLALSFYSFTEEELKSPVEELEITVSPKFNVKTGAELYVWDGGSGADAGEEFMEQVESLTVEATPLTGGERLEMERPEKSREYGCATRVSMMRYNARCGTNEICWTFGMKNGDTVILRNRVIICEQPSLIFTPEDTPLNTADELQTALDSLTGEQLRELQINFYLPDAVYDSPVTVPGGDVYIYSADPEEPAVFTAGVTVADGMLSGFDLVFEGRGGTGVTGNASVVLYNCTVRGWDTGVVANEGAWVTVRGCALEGNGVGLHFRSGYSTFSNPQYEDNLFADNGVGVLLEEVPGHTTLAFPGTTFVGNGENIRNLCDRKLDLSRAIFR